MKKLIIFLALLGMFGVDVFAQSKQFLYIKFSPTDATLSINGVEQETTDGVFEDLMPLGREYKCTISKDGYKTENRNILMTDPNKTYAIEENLNKIHKYGSLLIKSNPSRANIYIDGQYAGQTPRYIPEILIGQHIVRVLDEEYDINIEEGQEIELTVSENHEAEAEEEDDEPIPFQLIEEKPSFQGGDANQFSKWVNQNLVYPEGAKSNGIQGRVTLQFIIRKDGSITNVRVLRGAFPDLDKEAIRVVSSSPKWTPGKQGGQAVSVSYTFPVIFQLR